MVIGDFYRVLQTAGAQITILRPSTSESFTIYLAGPGEVRTEALLQDSVQGDQETMMCRLDFDGQLFTEPQRGDRLSRSGEEYSVQQVLPRFGPDRELFGWKVRLRA